MIPIAPFERGDKGNIVNFSKIIIHSSGSTAVKTIAVRAENLQTPILATVEGGLSSGVWKAEFGNRGNEQWISGDNYRSL